jgi:hypothetical protein
MKCGTTSLHYYLSTHPQIFMSARKELDFFSNDATYARGLDWYSAQFQTTQPVRGESSPNYSKRHLFPETAARLVTALPDVRLIYLVRDPIDRLISHFVHGQSKTSVTYNLSKLMRADSHEARAILLTGKYMYQLEPFLGLLGEQRIMVVPLEQLEKERDSTLRRIVSFVGADPQQNLEISAAKKLNSAKRRSQPTALGELADRAPEAVRQPLRRLLRRLPNRLTQRPIAAPSLDSSDLDWLATYYRSDTEKLERFMGIKTGWIGRHCQSAY